MFSLLSSAIDESIPLFESMKISKISTSNLRYLPSSYHSVFSSPFSGNSIRHSYHASYLPEFSYFYRYQIRRHGWPPLSYVICPPKLLSLPTYYPNDAAYSGQILNFYIYLAQSLVGFRFHSVLSAPSSQFKKSPTDKHRPGASLKQALQIVCILTGDERSVDSKLGFLDGRLSIALVAQVFRVLNSKRRPALHFFYWIMDRHPKLGCNPEVCSLVIDNCGRLNDYNAMRGLLNDFRIKGIPLTRKAFEYLPIVAVNETELKELTETVIIMLKEIGGIYYLTGVHALIEIFSVIGYFSMAKFVIEKTERRFSFYDLLFRGMCLRCEFGGARKVMDEMRNKGFQLGQSYNYLISNLLKNGEIGVALAMFHDMKEKECPPDALTYEVFICHYCNNNNLEVAFEFLADMSARGLQPRLTTHAAFIRGYFNSGKYVEAHKYIVDSDDKYFKPVNYSLLARLHLKAGNAIKAENILSEMIEKGFRPNNKVYVEVRKRLRISVMVKLAAELEMKFCRLEHRN